VKIKQITLNRGIKASPDAPGYLPHPFHIEKLTYTLNIFITFRLIFTKFLVNFHNLTILTKRLAFNNLNILTDRLRFNKAEDLTLGLNKQTPFPSHTPLLGIAARSGPVCIGG
jgi:hypothetical protein